MSNSCCREFPKGSPSSPTALDRAKAQAPVWRENFKSADTTGCGPLSADSTPGNTLDCRLREEKKRRLRIGANCVWDSRHRLSWAAQLGFRDCEIVEPLARLDSRGRLSPHDVTSSSTPFRSLADAHSPRRRLARARFRPLLACLLRTNARSELLREVRAGVGKTSAKDDLGPEPNRCVLQTLL